jgi:hypothetical protein
MASPARITVDDPRAQRVLFDALKERARGRTELVKLTRGDAVALTGLPTEQAEPALKSLVRTYRSHLAVTDDGEMVYEFDPSLERRDRVTLGERLAQAGELAWRGFRFAFKIWIVVTLIAYVIAFLAMMISLVVVRSSSDRDDRRGGDGFGLPWIWYWMMPDLAPRDPYYGRRMRRPKSQKRFYQAVFDYVFGPKQAPVDPRAGDKVLLGFLRDHKGRITASELVSLTGLSLEAADEELTRLMVEYDGEVQIADDGTLIYVFEGLLQSAGGVATSWRYSWDQPDVAPALTGNTPGANTAITGFAAFNLIASLTIGPAFLTRVHLGGDPLATFFVTLFPLLFSLVFFAVPGVRLLVARRRERRRRTRRLRGAVLRRLWARAAEPFEPDTVAASVASAEGVTPAAARQMVDHVHAELEGDADTDESGHVRYKLPRLAEEQAAVEKARAAAKPPQLGPVVFSSDSDDK